MLFQNTVAPVYRVIDRIAVFTFRIYIVGFPRNMIGIAIHDRKLVSAEILFRQSGNCLIERG